MPELRMQVLGLINRDHSSHVLLLHKIDYLTTICYYFQRLASHDNFFVLENLPVLESTHDSREYLIEVLVNWRMLVAKLLGLIEQVFAEQVSLDFDLAVHVAFIFAGFAVTRQLVLLLDLFDDAALSILLLFGSLEKFLTGTN